MAAVSRVPVINLLSDRSHPLQAIADVLTLRSRWGGKLAGRRLAWVGDGNNVARSLVLACAMSGVSVALASPPGRGLDEVTLDAIVALGGSVTVASSPAEAVRGADAVSTDVWVSMGQEGEAMARLDAFRPYQVGAQLMALAAPGAVFIHCLPAHRGEEVTADVIDGPSSAVWEQAGNRLRAMRGLLLWMFGGPAGLS
jgi:ornithine carbamoyltransferase